MGGARWAAVACLSAACGGAIACRRPEPPLPTGMWDAAVVVRDRTVPFAFEITGTPADLSASFFDGDLRVPSTSGHYENGRVVLRFDQYGAMVDARLEDGRLEGAYDRGTRGPAYPFTAVPAQPAVAPSTPAPVIDGEWRLLLDEPNKLGERAWDMVVRQSGARVQAAILRVDGDTGTLSGSFKDGAFALSHFSGARPAILVMTPAADGSMRLLLDHATGMTAVRPHDRRAETGPSPVDPSRHTRVANPDEKFRFSFPDLDGRLVSDTDSRFAGKVVIVSVTGTWCPNCHDEAPFLSQLYRDYHGKGLEIVALAFEEPEQLKDLRRVRGFVRQYGITYPMLLAGTPEEAAAKLPQAVNLTTFPATFVLGKDGLVRATYAGYASRATGLHYDRAQRAFLAEIDRLLAEG